MVFIIEARATASIIFPFVETIDAALKANTSRIGSCQGELFGTDRPEYSLQELEWVRPVIVFHAAIP